MKEIKIEIVQYSNAEHVDTWNGISIPRVYDMLWDTFKNLWQVKEVAWKGPYLVHVYVVSVPT